MDNQTNTKSSPKPTFSPYQEGVKKALKQMGEQQTIEALQQGVPAQHIEQQSGLSQQDILNQILQMSQQKVPAKQEQGGAMSQLAPNGLIGGLLNMSKGQSFNAPKTEPLGINNAIQLQGAMQSGQKNSMDAQKFPLEMKKLESDVDQAPLQTQKLKTEVAKGEQELIQMQPGFQKDGMLKANELFTRYEQAVQPFIVQRDAYSRIKESGKDPSPAGDLALLYGYMKLLDPGSTVREGEFATAQNSGSIPQRIAGLYNRALSGKRLPDVQRKDFLNRSEMIFKSSDRQRQKLDQQFDNLARNNKIKPGIFRRDASLEEDQVKEKPKTPFAQEAPKGATGWDTEKGEWVY